MTVVFSQFQNVKFYYRISDSSCDDDTDNKSFLQSLNDYK